MLNHKNPHEVLFNKLPDYDNLRVFGCLTFAANPVNTADKFEHRGVPCLFVGYPPFQKGYKLFNLLTNKHFVSRDVQFNEEIFPFHSSDKNKFMTHIPPSYNHVPSIEDLDFS